MLSRLYRKAETLDGACLRAWGHPHDYAVREELLSALEWGSTVALDHVRPSIRMLVAQAQARSSELSTMIRMSSDHPSEPSTAGMHRLRESLAALMHLLETRSTPRKDDLDRGAP